MSFVPPRRADAPLSQLKSARAERPSLVDQPLQGGARPAIPVLPLLAEFYLVDMMRAEQAEAFAKDAACHLRRPVERWLEEVPLEVLHRQILEQKVPQLYRLLAHLVADELSCIHVDPPYSPRGPVTSLPALREERLWLRSVAGDKKEETSSRAILEAAAARGFSYREFATLAVQLFRDEGHWGKVFGGEHWWKAAEALGSLLPGMEVAWLDGLCHLQHNTGHLFTDKLGAGDFDAEAAQVLLDYRSARSNPVEFLALIQDMGIEISPELERAAVRGAHIRLWALPESPLRSALQGINPDVLVAAGYPPPSDSTWVED